MFNKKENNASINIIGFGTRLTGKLTGESIRVDGYFNGDADIAGKIAIGQTGTFDGKIKTDIAEIAGIVNGSIDATDIIIIRDTAVITGDLSATNYIVDKGAKINGKVKTNVKIQN